ncbi:MAG: indole-3-glycerol-phosphate synthase [Candidatus Syntropharchaeia archaeon]
MRSNSSLAESIRRKQKEGVFPVISEIKLRSEKEGDLLRGRDPLHILQEMISSPIAGISVVTEEEHFGGSMELLKDIAKSVSLPVLRKDFIRTPDQVKESGRAGASTVLLISSILSDDELLKLLDACRMHGLESLVEVHTPEDVERVRGLEFDLLGINNRDITILEVNDTDVSHTELLIEICERSRPIISESSIRSPEDARRAGRAGADAVLIGTAVMKARDMSLCCCGSRCSWFRRRVPDSCSVESRSKDCSKVDGTRTPICHPSDRGRG